MEYIYSINNPLFHIVSIDSAATLAAAIIPILSGVKNNGECFFFT